MHSPAGIPLMPRSMLSMPSISATVPFLYKEASLALTSLLAALSSEHACTLHIMNGYDAWLCCAKLAIHSWLLRLLAMGGLQLCCGMRKREFEKSSDRGRPVPGVDHTSGLSHGTSGSRRPPLAPPLPAKDVPPCKQ